MTLKVRLDITRGSSGLLIGHSPDLPALHVMERTEAELLAEARALARILKGIADLEVEITPAGRAELGKD